MSAPQPTPDNGVLPMTFDEIDAWRSMWERRFRVGLEMGEDEQLLTEAAAMMRRALRYVPEGATPAPSALREAAKALIARVDPKTSTGPGAVWQASSVYHIDQIREEIAALRTALAAAPEAASAAKHSGGVVVPERAREWAELAKRMHYDGERFPVPAKAAADFILSLPAAPQPPERSAAQAVSEPKLTALLHRFLAEQAEIGYGKEPAWSELLEAVTRALLARLGGEGRGGA